MIVRRETIEPILRRIVEGQLRSFGQSHPSIVEAVDWGYDAGTRNRSRPKIDTFVNSGAKRIVNALLCEETLERLRSALAAGDSPEE